MRIETEQLFTNVTPRTLLGRVVQFPLTRFIIVLVFLAPPNLAVMATSSQLESAGDLIKTLVAAVLAVALYLLYCLYTRLIEHRKALEMTLAGGWAEFGKGTAVGIGLMVTLVALLAAGGYYRIESYAFDWSLPFSALIKLTSAAFFEELVFRLILFKITEEALGSWVALVVQAALFGALHGGNPNATLFSSVAIMVEAGVLLAAVYMVTRRIWMVLGLHLAWNFTQSTVFGIAVSGHSGRSLITPAISGPDWLTGGAFGVEASWPAIVLCLAVGLLFLRHAIKSGRLVVPVWRRKDRPSLETTPL